nr:MAG TPA: hypothetical protein [Caudoviricetes sp.]
MKSASSYATCLCNGQKRCRERRSDQGFSIFIIACVV